MFKSSDFIAHQPVLVLGHIAKWVHVWVWGIFFINVLVIASIYFAYSRQDVWAGWRESSEIRQPLYAETVHIQSVFRTRANTWSNLAYVLVGLYAIMLGVHDMRRRPPVKGGYLIQTPVMSILFGTACCYLGFASGIFHASLTRWGQQLDVAAMYSPLVVLIALNIGRWCPDISVGNRDIPTWPILGVLSIVASVLLYIYKWSISSGVVMPILIVIVLSFFMLDRFKTGVKLASAWMVVAFVSLVFSAACRWIDISGRVFTGGDSWIQGHSFWHLFTSTCLACTYAYYRSETES